MPMPVNDLRKGDSIVLDGELYLVVEASFHRQQQRKANVKARLKNVKKGTVIEKSFSSTETVEPADVSFQHVQYLYRDESQGYVFMNLNDYNQFGVSEEIIGDDHYYLLDGMELDLQFHNEEPIAVRLPIHVVLEVEYTEPGFKGDTTSGGTKPAKMHTGIVIQAPLFVEIGEKLKIDTRDNSYVERVKE